jgi:hypothetical protein
MASGTRSALVALVALAMLMLLMQPPVIARDTDCSGKEGKPCSFSQPCDTSACIKGRCEIIECSGTCSPFGDRCEIRTEADCKASTVSYQRCKKDRTVATSYP